MASQGCRQEFLGGFPGLGGHGNMICACAVPACTCRIVGRGEFGGNNH